MKRQLEIALIFCLTTIIIPSASAGNCVSREFLLDPLFTSMDDTTNFGSYIKVDTFRLTILPPSSGVQFYKNNIVFLSRSKDERKMTPNQISFGAVEAYYASVEDSVTGRHMIFSPMSAFSYPCDAMTFSRDYSTVYFTKIPKKGNKEKIFIGKLIPNSTNPTQLVSETQPLDFCRDNFNYSHPALSADEKLMVFASDRNGPLAGMDLFISRNTGNQWSAPESIGDSINTPGNEFFPFLDSDNNLFFSSDGLPGYGGYDIFICRFNGTGWDKPINLSASINSVQDDIAFSINKTDGRSAFFTRRQRLGKAEMQLFRVTLRQKADNQNLLSVSQVFTRKSVNLALQPATSTAKEVQAIVTEPANIRNKANTVKKEEQKVTKTTTGQKPLPEKEKPGISETSVSKPESKVIGTGNKPAISKTITSPVEQKDNVIYRVQLLPSASQKSSGEIVINGTSYKLYKYVYLGTTRYTIGEFTRVSLASALLKLCRQTGYPQSFIVAFRNNVRSLDPELFK
jgi:hypothetical protein